MRKFIISLLLAGAAASPALASPPDSDSDQPRYHRGDRAEARRDSKPARTQSPDRPAMEQRRSEPREQPRFEPGVQAPRPMTSEPGWGRRGPDDNPVHAGRDPRASLDRPNPGESIDQIQQRIERRQDAVRRGGAGATGGPRLDADAGREARHDRFGSRNPLVISDVPRPGTQPPPRTEHRTNPAVKWSDGWRRDHRYDWQDHRRRHRSIFHVGVYFDPFGWNYRPYQVGWRMWPSYYGSRYWINDPWQYRLPYAPPGYRWVRYWDDALLVDTWSGQVVDVIRDFFW